MKSSHRPFVLASIGWEHRSNIAKPDLQRTLTEIEESQKVKGKQIDLLLCAMYLFYSKRYYFVTLHKKRTC